MQMLWSSICILLEWVAVTLCTVKMKFNPLKSKLMATEEVRTAWVVRVYSNDDRPQNPILVIKGPLNGPYSDDKAFITTGGACMSPPLPQTPGGSKK